MNFGKYMRRLLDDRETNFSALSKKVGIRSKNELYRLFKNEYSYEKTKLLTEKIVSVIDVTDAEYEKIYRLMESCRMKSSMRKGLEILESIYKDIEKGKTSIENRLYHFLKHNNSANVTLFIGAETSGDTITVLDGFLNDNPENPVSLIHTVNFNRSEEVIASQLFAIIKLIPYADYKCYELSKTILDGIVGLADANGEYSMFIVTPQNEFSESPISRELYDFIMKKYGKCKNGTQLKKMRGNITDYAGIFNEFSIIEVNDNFAFGCGMCFAEIPFDTMYNMLKEANYFGLPPESEYITGIVKAARDRVDLRSNSDAQSRYVLAEDRMHKFLSTGYTPDHVAGFRPLEKKELSEMLEYCVNDPRKKYRFFKQGYSYPRAETGLVYDKCLFMWDASAKYQKNFWQLSIKHPRAIEVFKNFTEYFWDNCTLPADESTKKLQNIIKKYL